MQWCIWSIKVLFYWCTWQEVSFQQPLYYFSCLNTAGVTLHRRRERWKGIEGGWGGKSAHSDSYVSLSPSLCSPFVCRLPCLMEAVVLLCLTGSDSVVRCNLTTVTSACACVCVCVGCVQVGPSAAVYIMRSLHLGLPAVFTLSSVLINTSTACRNNSHWAPRQDRATPAPAESDIDELAFSELL